MTNDVPDPQSPGPSDPAPGDAPVGDGRDLTLAGLFDDPDDPDGPGDADGRTGGGHRGRNRPWRTRRGVAAIAAAVVLVAALAAAVVVPMPYVVEGPGPTYDVIGATKGTPMISITGTDPSTGRPVVVDPVPSDDSQTGQLRMVTVSEWGGPGERLNFVQLVQARFDSRVEIIPFKEAYPDGVTQQQVQEAGKAQMQSSQSTAGVAALELLGWKVPATVTIEGAVAGSGAEGKVKQGDTLVSMTTPDGTVHPVDSASVPFAVMRTQPVGSRVVLTVSRAGKDVEVPITSVSGGDGSEGSKLGIYLSAEVDMPLDITIHLERVGGPSAGTMFALGIIDRLTPGDMTGGQRIAGTGALSYDGQVEPIGGIRQKMWGAVADGAKWFLAPVSNCDEVVGHVPDGLQVVKVSTLEGARQAVGTIAAGKGASLPTCTAADAQSGAAGS